jgi:prophage regulatory protein
MPEDTRKRFIDLVKVKEATQRSRAAIYAAMAEGKFPKSVRISAGRVAWVENEIQDWIASRIAERDASASNRKAA